MTGLWQSLLELVYPWRCPLCRAAGEAPDGLCPSCRALLELKPSWRCLSCGRVLPGMGGACCPEGRSASLDGLLSATDYGPVARRAIHRFKFGGDALAGRALAQILAGIAGERLEVPLAAAVPVPLAPARQRERGYNQAGLLARRIARRLEVRVDYGLLTRSRETEPQVGATPSARRRNVAGAFGIRPGRKVPAGGVLLVDDVYTTGATMNECARVLKEAGVSAVFGIVFSCSPWRAGGDLMDGDKAVV